MVVLPTPLSKEGWCTPSVLTFLELTQTTEVDESSILSDVDESSILSDVDESSILSDVQVCDYQRLVILDEYIVITNQSDKC